MKTYHDSFTYGLGVVFAHLGFADWDLHTGNVTFERDGYLVMVDPDDSTVELDRDHPDGGAGFGADAETRYRVGVYRPAESGIHDEADDLFIALGCTRNLVIRVLPSLLSPDFPRIGSDRAVFAAQWLEANTSETVR